MGCPLHPQTRGRGRAVGDAMTAGATSTGTGLLYVVATPIGNLGDMSPRAIEVLQSADLIAAEDTRHSGRLLAHFNIGTACVALHEHNERRAAPELVARMQAGAVIALISDAGTPLLSDPGYVLVRTAVDAGIVVLPVPGASAMLAALSVSGLATDRFVFEGFLPSRSGPRQRRLGEIRADTRTLLFYEAPHRLLETLTDMSAVLGGQRRAVLARELTKRFETVLHGSLEQLRDRLLAGEEHRGECVLLVAGAAEADAGDEQVQRILEVLGEELPASKAAALAARITGRKRKPLYEQLLAMRSQSG